jgi:uncharacterized membrane protein
MFPGLTTKLSEEVVATATTITVRKDLVRLTGTTAIATIDGQFGGGFSGIIFLVPTEGNVAITTAGNIAAAVTMVDQRVTVLVFSKEDNIWYPGAIS